MDILFYQLENAQQFWDGKLITKITFESHLTFI